MKQAVKVSNPNTPNETALPTDAPGGLTAGLDWAREDPTVCVLDWPDKVRNWIQVQHTSTGLGTLVSPAGRTWLRRGRLRVPRRPSGGGVARRRT